MFYTGSNKSIPFEDIPEAIYNFYEKNKNYGSEIHIIVGTDSQNFDITKMVSVIAVTCDGHGGIFFYEKSFIDLISNVKLKLQTETYNSLQLTEKLVDALTSDEKYSDLFLSCPISIHIDAGNSTKGKTKELIPELVGYVKSFGYETETKPKSFVASSIADRLSK